MISELCRYWIVDMRNSNKVERKNDSWAKMNINKIKEDLKVTECKAALIEYVYYLHISNFRHDSFAQKNRINFATWFSH